MDQTALHGVKRFRSPIYAFHCRTAHLLQHIHWKEEGFSWRKAAASGYLVATSNPGVGHDPIPDRFS